jgi:hypothetical protein
MLPDQRTIGSITFRFAPMVIDLASILARVDWRGLFSDSRLTNLNESKLGAG